LLSAILERGLDKFRVAKSDNSGNIRIKELIYLAICGLAAIAIYFVWQALSLSNSHVKAGHELDPTESLNDH
jgi:hypothetical protein